MDSRLKSLIINFDSHLPKAALNFGKIVRREWHSPQATLTHSSLLVLDGAEGAAEGDSESPLPLTYVCSSWATLDLTMCAACKPSTLSSHSLLAPFAVSVGNGLNIALHSRTLKSRNDRTQPNEGGTKERARPRGRRRRRSALRPSDPPSLLLQRSVLVERGEKRKSEIGYGRHRLRNVGSSTSAERVPDSTGIFLTWS